METKTVVSKQEHETVDTDASGNEIVHTETITTENEIPVEPTSIVIDDETEDEGIDETWLTEKFSGLSAQLNQLLNQSVSQMELVSRLMEMNQSLQVVLTQMAEKLTIVEVSKNLTPLSSPEQKTETITEVIPEKDVVENPEAKTPQRIKRKIRKI